MMPVDHRSSFQIRLGGISFEIDNAIVETMPDVVRKHYALIPYPAEAPKADGKIRRSQDNGIFDILEKAADTGAGTVKYLKDRQTEHYGLLDKHGLPVPLAFSLKEKGLISTVHYRYDIQEQALYNIFGKRRPDPLFNGLCDIFLYAILLSYRNGVIMHGAGVIDEKGRGLLICGYSGAGKTTLSEKLKRLGYTVINDDCVIIRRMSGGLYLFPTPWIWRPETMVGHRKPAPLSAVILLEKGRQGSSRAERLSPDEALLALMEHTFFFHSLENRRPFLVDILLLMCKNIFNYRLYHVLTDPADPLRNV